jgi:hypothetical protein
LPTHSLKTRTLSLCLSLFLAVLGVAQAGAQGDSRLAEAEKLIQQQDYSNALLLLAAIQRSNPELRDQTNRLTAQIMAVTRRFNTVLEQLNQAVQAGDAQKIQAYMSELNKIDPARAAASTSQAATLAGFLKLMNNAAALLAAGKPRDALALYVLALTDPEKSGVRLPRAEFEAAGYGEILTTSVKGTTAALLAAAKKEADAPPDLSSLRSALSLLLAHPGQDAAAQFDDLTQPLLFAAFAEGSVRQNAGSLSDIARTIQRSSGRGREDPYLRYLQDLTLGRSGRQEGIAFAMRRLWADDAQKAAVTASDAFTSAFESARSAFASGRLTAADAELRVVPVRAALVAKAVALASAQFDFGTAGAWKIPVADPRAKDLMDRVLAVQEFAAEAQGYRTLISFRGDLDALPAVGTGAISAAGGAESAQLTAARATLDARSTLALAQEAAWSARSKAWEARAEVTGAAPSLAISARAMAGRFATFADVEIPAKDLQYALRIAAIAATGFPKRLKDATAQLDRVGDLKDGTVDGKSPPAGVLSQKHPDQAVQILAAVKNDLDSLISDISGQEQQLQGEKPWVKTSPGFTALFQGTAGGTGYNGLQQNARTQRDRAETLSASAQGQVDAASLSSKEGDNYFKQAQDAVKAGDFVRAPDLLDKATAAYTTSLANMYTDHAFSRANTEAADLNGRIQTLQYASLVADAQKAVTAINRFIGNRDFLRASDALDAAVRSWNQAGQGTYQPFDTLRLTIQAAQEISRGREISRFDPKADVVNAFIKNAQDALAVGALADAAQDVRDALAVAPNFGAGKVLQLRIRKQADPAAFERDAAARIAVLRRMAADDRNRDGQKAAYLELQDYAQLDPKFDAPTRDIRQKLELSLGIARKQTSDAQKIRSAALTRQADLVQQAGTEEALLRALDVVKQALQANPDNGEALQLDGQIRKKLAATSATALSPGDTQAYNQALLLFYSGGYQDAYTLVLKLWDPPSSPRNRTYAPLVRLKRKLEVQLNLS